MKIVSIILARGGSKGIPNKNIINLNGKPLIQYTIEASLNSIIGNETYVSSDSNKILKEAKRVGAKTIKRPLGISGDFDKSELSLLDFINKIKSDILVFIQPTSPLITSNHLNKGINKLLNNKNLNSVFSVYEEHWVPKWDQYKKPIDWDINNRPMRQEVENYFIENGAFYVSRTSLVKKNKLRYSPQFEYVIMNKEESIQVDSINDLNLISKILN